MLSAARHACKRRASAGLAFLGLIPMLTTLAWKIRKMKKKKRFLGIERKYTETHLST